MARCARFSTRTTRSPTRHCAPARSSSCGRRPSTRRPSARRRARTVPSSTARSRASPASAASRWCSVPTTSTASASTTRRSCSSATRPARPASTRTARRASSRSPSAFQELLDNDVVRGLLPWLGTWRPGTSANVLDVAPQANAGGVRIAPLICYDAVDPGLARRAVRDGAQLLVTLSNDAWFASGDGPLQHFVVAGFRSIETRTPQVRATTTGISGIVTATGETLARGRRRACGAGRARRAVARSGHAAASLGRLVPARDPRRVARRTRRDATTRGRLAYSVIRRGGGDCPATAEGDRRAANRTTCRRSRAAATGGAT